jgi:hypothetical protein
MFELLAPWARSLTGNLRSRVHRVFFDRDQWCCRPGTDRTLCVHARIANKMCSRKVYTLLVEPYPKHAGMQDTKPNKRSGAYYYYNNECCRTKARVIIGSPMLEQQNNASKQRKCCDQWCWEASGGFGAAQAVYSFSRQAIFRQTPVTDFEWFSMRASGLAHLPTLPYTLRPCPEAEASYKYAPAC